MPNIEYRAEDVKSTVCAQGTDFEHNVYWLDNGVPEGEEGYAFRYLTPEEKVQYAADKVALDEAAAARRENVLAARSGG